MKILHVNKYYYLKGGPEGYLFKLIELQKAKGHEIAVFCMKHNSNMKSDWEQYFVENVNYESESIIKDSLKGIKTLYSFEAEYKLEQLVNSFKPDICHLHNIWHQLTPSILRVIKKHQIPAVMKLTDFKLVCPSWYLTYKGKPCELCKNRKYYNAIIKSCHKNSFIKSLLVAMESYLHHYVLKSYNSIRYYICPSNFLLIKMKELGLKGEFIYLPNYIDVISITPEFSNDGNTIAYWGRISQEKGIKTLVEAVEGLNIKLLIIGDGPIKNDLMQYVQKKNISNIEFIAHLTPDVLRNRVKNIMFSICPSECYENNPNSVLESFAFGKPVIGANIGGIPELIFNNETGLLFESGNKEDLRSKIMLLNNNKNKIMSLGKNARKLIEDRFNQTKHYKELINIYDKVIKEKNENKNLFN